MIVGAIAAGLLLAVALAAAGLALRRAGGRRPGPRPFSGTSRHYGAFYSRRTFLHLGAATVAAFALAHTGVDQAVADAYERRLRGAGVDRASAVWKGFGEKSWFFVWLPFALLDGLVATHPVLAWGRRNFEATIVGLPMLWTLQRFGGASRPREERGSRWRPLADDNTASGHTFLAAIPWLNAGRALDPAILRTLAWLGSWGTGWSRLNDRQHYLSQVVYGHAIAARAVAAVAEGEAARTR